MTQAFELIGGVSPELEAVAARRAGWQGQRAEPPGQEATDATDFSFQDRRANLQALGWQGGTMAAYREEPMAARQVIPPGHHDTQSPSQFWPPR